MANPVNQEPVVNLYSSDGVHFQVPKRLAMFSGAIKRILEDVPQEALSSNTGMCSLVSYINLLTFQFCFYSPNKSLRDLQSGADTSHRVLQIQRKVFGVARHRNRSFLYRSEFSIVANDCCWLPGGLSSRSNVPEVSKSFPQSSLII